jgi:hypothetical protein
MSEAENHREFTRVHVKVDTEVKALGRTIHSFDSQDLSLKGMLVRTEERLPRGTPCEVRLLLGDHAAEILADGLVVRDYDEGFAVQFTRLLGVESYEHLKNLVLYNAQDTARIEQEFQEHLGLRRKD